MGGLSASTPDAQRSAAGASLGGALPVVYADEHLVVVDKPAGLLCVPGRGADKQDCLSARVQAVFSDALIVHRLDQATSGLCLFARGAAMQKAMSGLFAQRAVDKRYVACVAGQLLSAGDRWTLIDLPIAADWPRRPLRVIDSSGQASQTLWRAVAWDPSAGATRVELQPLTGRTHQLRVHMQAIGHPILGDALYAPPAVCAAAPRLLLHASSLSFTHPATGQPLGLESPAPF